jgi:VanZ family protein
MSISAIRWLSCAYAVALGYLLLAPEPLFFLGGTGAAIDATVSATVADWIEHGAAYAILAGLFIAAFRDNRLTWPLLAALVHGIVTESSQNWIPHREAGWVDFMANVCGIAAAGVTAMVIRLQPFGRAASSTQPGLSNSPVLFEMLDTGRDQ